MENSESHLAKEYVLHTHKNIFLTGRAGTGKTTLLKKIAEQTTKNFVIAAPTGVAAINAGGVTIHSMFHFPTTSFIPTNDYVDLNIATNRRLLLSHLKFRREKLQLIRELELLILDEVSMVRCDIMDAIDFTLRTLRRNQKPFGGVQVLLIGDMHQLPPVVRSEEWEILQQYYRSPYFFDSLVWKQLDAWKIELKKIYRQSEEKFLNILNNIRHQRIEPEDFEELKKRYNPIFKPTEPGYILLTTHNYKADNVNERELRKLPGRLHTSEAEIEGDFPENMYPCEKVLQLKEGAQVMFIKNDLEEGRYYNGSLALVKRIEGENIMVTLRDNNEDFWLRKETWKNIRYTMERGTEKITKEELGTFSQFPLRLAWAITIHKSQGLTFDKVIVDAGHSFAAGQVYVALSRCRTLDGIVLHSLIRPNMLYSDERISEFSDGHHGISDLQNQLAPAKAEYAAYLLKRLFDFQKLSDCLADWKEKDIPGKQKVIELFEHISAQTEKIIATSDKFQKELERLLHVFAETSDSIKEQDVYPALRNRCDKAIAYFTEQIFTQLITPLHKHIEDFAFKSRVKKYVQHVQETEDSFWNKVNRLYDARYLDKQLYSGEKKYSRNLLRKIISSTTSGKKQKGGTYNDTLALYKQGMKLEEIASVRNLAISTIKSHIAKWIQSGEIDVFDVLPVEIIHRIEKYLDSTHADSYSAIKSAFGDDVDYGDIRMVVNHRARKREVSSTSTEQ
ncbi:MAG TPA: helix-turn-helix domain-containing protein [Chitinophagales bacterium]|nr:helix-turn-helix domain-containing protein [Chitinophagales bacterium]